MLDMFQEYAPFSETIQKIDEALKAEALKACVRASLNDSLALASALASSNGRLASKSVSVT